jgi:hypothetical protein
MIDSRELTRIYLQGKCSQPQPISATPDFSAFSQYSLQYFSSLLT